ncbi:S-adenosyl-L-methionine-dependent methyltransferase [Collybia nuda]|uniref:S-adenosyl-L-methionine-dependent methyltransferase n=1 Tax=Collybia nuda TaxID=64659 RepID=A0A9P6CMC2_9AGAR|nr:S-adenosyl-L-methionine-dependent methyltransferase [Collybia nuda]
MEGNMGTSYKLSSDANEMDRLATQHRMWCLLIGGLYPRQLQTSIEDLLLDESSSILDVGCGSGIWATEMAMRFPRSAVIGFDLTEQHYTGNLPNFKFIQGDLAHGLPQSFKGRFSVAHCRCVAQHVSDPQALVKEIAGCLKPGGILILSDGDWVAFDANKDLLVPFRWDPNVDEVTQANNEQGRSWYAGWLEMFERLTRSPKYQPVDTLVRESGQFSGIQYSRYFSPINWPGNDIEHGEEIGRIMNRNMREFFENGVTPMLNSGLSQKMIDIWRTKFEEAMDLHLYNVWHVTSARKNGHSAKL